MSNQKPTLPSEQLQSVLNLFEKHLKNGVLSDKSLPEWYVMATALVTAHAAFDAAGKINVMFDATNSFDVAMLVWCTESSVREKRRTAVASVPDPTQN